MTQAELAKAVGCGLSTIHEFESGRRSPQAYVLAIQHILEERGIIFHPRGIDGPDGK
jgi:transcriptional regulator with XRE-family HTH domain